MQDLCGYKQDILSICYVYMTLCDVQFKLPQSSLYFYSYNQCVALSCGTADTMSCISLSNGQLHCTFRYAIPSITCRKDSSCAATYILLLFEFVDFVVLIKDFQECAEVHLLSSNYKMYACKNAHNVFHTDHSESVLAILSSLPWSLL